MQYVVNYKGWKNIDFQKHLSALRRAGINYNSASINAGNPKKILSIRVMNSEEIQITFLGKKRLSQGTEANALWLFSHDLAENQGFDIYLTKKRKLLRAA